MKNIKIFKSHKKTTSHNYKNKHVNSKWFNVAFNTFTTLILLNIVLVSISLLFNVLSFLPQANVNNIVSSITALVLIFVPKFIKIRFRVSFNEIVRLLYIIYIFSGVVFGFGYGFYATIYGYDKIIHFASGALISLIVLDFFKHHNSKNENNLKQISPFFTSIFSFSFSVMLLTLWEVYEFGVDTLSHLLDSATASNMQRYMWGNASKIFPQTYGLLDTMLDIIVGLLGALLVSIIGYIAITRKNRQLKTNKNISHTKKQVL